MLRVAPDLGQQLTRHLEQRQQVVIPLALLEVHQERARGVGEVGLVRIAASQSPQQEAVNGAKGQLPTRRALSRPRDMIEDPGDLGPREVRIEHQARLGLHLRLLAAIDQLVDAMSRAAILPDDGVVNRTPRVTLPDDGRLALVGDTDGDDLLGRDARLGLRGLNGLQGGVPDRLRIVLDPAGLRIDLRVFLVHAGAHLERLIQQERGGAGGALIDGADQLVRHGGASIARAVRGSRA